MSRIAVALAVVFLGAELHAQNAQTTMESSSIALPPLIRDLTIHPNDSAVVRAAKIIAAQRRQPGRTIKVITNDVVASSTGRIAVANEPIAPLPAEYSSPAPSTASGPPASAPTPTGSPVSAAQAQAQREQRERLLREQNRMRQEAEQQYGDEVDEDQVAKRLQEIPQELNRPNPQ